MIAESPGLVRPDPRGGFTIARLAGPGSSTRIYEGNFPTAAAARRALIITRRQPPPARLKTEVPPC